MQFINGRTAYQDIRTWIRKQLLSDILKCDFAAAIIAHKKTLLNSRASLERFFRGATLQIKWGVEHEGASFRSFLSNP
jgi:hypothetical protein